MAHHKYTYYQVLGIQPAVSSLEIKRAYRQLVKSLHPDIDHKKFNESERVKANERMAKINEAYETLKDKSTRAAYDYAIGVNGRGGAKVIRFPQENVEQSRAQYLKKILLPVRQSITRVLSQYNKQLSKLSADIYDQELVNDFEHYTNEIESTLRHASQMMTKNPAHSTLSAAELMMRRSIAQAVDGLEELRSFCSNYDYNHLLMAANLFRESIDLSRQAALLTKL